MDHLRDNQPNAAKLVNSLRNTGYNSYAAIEDIVDNSIDAHARRIDVTIELHQKEARIIVADDGSGMSEAVLDQALKLGSDTEKDTVSDLGKFGMGLCTASISFAKRLEVITREESGATLYSSQDLDDIAELNSFKKVLRPANSDEEQMLSDSVGKHGTVIVLTKIDRLSDNNHSQFAKKLKRDMSRIYRKFIEAGIVMSVNGEVLQSEDPLMSDMQGTTIYSDEEYELPPSAVNGKKEKLRIKIAILPEMNEQLERGLKMNIVNQGFYALRNNREVASGLTLDVFSKHNDFNRLRIELSFSATLDEEMGVRFSKDGISPNQAISDFLKQEISGQVSSIRKLFVKSKTASSEAMIDHSDSEQVIAQKAKLLITPKAEIEKRGPRVEKNDRLIEDRSGEKKREQFKNTKTSPHGLGAHFEVAAMGREGTLYEAYQEGKVIVIRWNSDHPFYYEIVLSNKDNKDIVSGLDYLIFALASAELKNINDDNVELMVNLKSVMSSNLRSLLS